MPNFWIISAEIKLAVVTVLAYIFLMDNAFAFNAGGAIWLALSPTPVTSFISTKYSAGDTPTGGTLCSIIGMVNSNIGQGLATLAVIFLGLAALFGQIKWTQAVLLGVGIAMIMGASTLVASLPSSTTTGGTTITSSGVDASLNSDGTVNSCN